AIELDPNFGGGYSGLALAYFKAAVAFGRGDQRAAQESVEDLARRAIALDPTDAEAHSCLAQALWARGDLVGAEAEIERVLTMTPNLASAYGVLGAVLIHSGRPAEGIAAIETYIRLDPRASFLRSRRLNQIASGWYFARDYGAAVEAANRAIRSAPLV